MKKPFFNLSVLIVLFFSSLYADQTTKGVSPETMRLINETNVDSARESGAVILLKESILTVDKNGMTSEAFHIVGKILDQKARLDFAQIPVLFDSYYEDVTVEFARSIRPGGATSEVYPDAISIETLPQIGGGIRYSDLKALTFSLPGLDTGVAFEYEVTVKEKKQVIDGAWFMSYPFNYILRHLASPFTIRMDPVVHSNLTVRVPPGKKFHYSMTVQSVSPAISHGKNYDEYRWWLKNISEIVIEAGMPPLEELNPSISISSLDSWKQIDQWAKTKFVVTAPIPDLVRKKAISLTEGAATKEEKIERIFHFIQRDVKYVSADLQRGGYTPHRPEDVLSNRYGDCKDQAMLFITLLSAVGVEAHPALLNPFPYPNVIDTEVPVPYFSHVIAYIPNDDGDLWLDTTPGVTPFPRLYFANQNRAAFIVNGRGGLIMTTSGSTASENEYGFNFSVSRNGPRADIVAEFRGKGAASDGLKQNFITLDNKDSYRLFQSLILFQYKKAIVDSVNISDVQDPEKSFQAVTYFHLEDIWSEKISDFTYGGNPRLALDFFIEGAQYPHPDSRHYTMYLGFPCSISGVETYCQPSVELSKTYYPKNDFMQTDFLLCYRRFTNTFSGVSAQWSMTCKQTEIQLQDYRLFYQNIERMKTMFDWSIVFYAPIEKKLRR